MANVIAACRRLREVPKIVGYRGTVNQLRLLDPANWITFWHPRVTKVVCVSHATERALLASGIPQIKLVPVWEGCAPESLCTPPRSSRGELGIPEGAFVVGVVTNMRPVKGIDLLLEAALQLEQRRDIYFVLVGEVSDPCIGALAADPRIADRIRLTGPCPGNERSAISLSVLGQGVSLKFTLTYAPMRCSASIAPLDELDTANAVTRTTD